MDGDYHKKVNKRAKLRQTAPRRLQQRKAARAKTVQTNQIGGNQISNLVESCLGRLNDRTRCVWDPKLKPLSRAACRGWGRGRDRPKPFAPVIHRGKRD